MSTNLCLNLWFHPRWIRKTTKTPSMRLVLVISSPRHWRLVARWKCSKNHIVWIHGVPIPNQLTFGSFSWASKLVALTMTWKKMNETILTQHQQMSWICFDYHHELPPGTGIKLNPQILDIFLASRGCIPLYTTSSKKHLPVAPAKDQDIGLINGMWPSDLP